MIGKAHLNRHADIVRRHAIILRFDLLQHFVDGPIHLIITDYYYSCNTQTNFDFLDFLSLSQIYLSFQIASQCEVPQDSQGRPSLISPHITVRDEQSRLVVLKMRVKNY